MFSSVRGRAEERERERATQYLDQTTLFIMKPKLVTNLLTESQALRLDIVLINDG